MTFSRRRLEPLAQRVRARIGKRIILDTTHAQLLFEDERHPWRAVPEDALRAPLAGPAVADNLDGHWPQLFMPGAGSCQVDPLTCGNITNRRAPIRCRPDRSFPQVIGGACGDW
jgi:hypothetical protein